MTKKERVLNVFTGKPIDRFPTQINYTDTMGKKICDITGCSFDGIIEEVDNHLLRVDLNHTKPLSEDGKTAYDWWGAGFDTAEEGYFVNDYPMADELDPDGYNWPDPEQPGLFDKAEKMIREDKGEHFIIPNFGFALFERAWSLRGLDTFMMDLYLEPEKSIKMLDRITEIQVELAKKYVALGVDGGYFGDDLGAQVGTLFSPDLFRDVFKPRFKKMFDVFTDAGLPVTMHSDGDIKPIIPDLVDIGLSCLNPCQPEVLDHTWLKTEFGKDLCFYGGVSTQQTMPYGTPEEVWQACEDAVSKLGGDGTGLLFGPSHRVMGDIPGANLKPYLDFCKQMRESEAKS